MPKVITNEKLIDEILTRGVEQIFPSREFLKKLLMSGKRIKLYCGFDPSASALHIGNAIAINKLSQFQDLGHEVIFLIGDFTGMIGDPTDKTAARKKMTREEVLENSKNFKKQAEAFLDFSGENSAIVKYNSEWNDILTFRDLVEITSRFTIQKFLNRDMFKKRMLGGKFNTYVVCRNCRQPFVSPIQFEDKKSFESARIENNETICPICRKPMIFSKKDMLQSEPIFFHEFLYPIAQAYDCVAMDVDLEIGGNDQMFNMLCGRDLMKAMKGKEKAVLTLKLLADSEGKKMGKTEGNAVFLDQEAFKMFENIMNWSDDIIGVAFELCTKVPFSEVKEIQEGLKNRKLNPRETKMRLAYEFVKLVHGEEKAKEAQEKYLTISKKETPEDILEVVAEENMKLTEFLVKANLADSNSDAKRKIEQGGVEINSEKITDSKKMINSEDDGKVLRVGKSDFVRIKF